MISTAQKTLDFTTDSATSRPLTAEEKRQEAIVEKLYQRSLKLYAPVWDEWMAVARSRLKQGQKLSLKDFKLEKMAGLIQRLSYVGNLSGQEDVRQEVQALESRFKTDASRSGLPEWLELPFAEAIEYFKSKRIVPNANYAELTEGYHDWAFSVAGVTAEDLLREIQTLLARALEEGTSQQEFEAELEKALIAKGWGTGMGAKRTYTIFDTNIRGAIGTGRGQQMKALADENPERNYVVGWRWRDSPQPRPHHQALHNKAIPISHPFWEQCRTPAGFGCRCSTQLFRPTIAQRLGIEILPDSKVPNPKTISDPGFRYPLWGGGREAREAFIANRGTEPSAPP